MREGKTQYLHGRPFPGPVLHSISLGLGCIEQHGESRTDHDTLVEPVSTSFPIDRTGIVNSACYRLESELVIIPLVGWIAG